MTNPPSPPVGVGPGSATPNATATTASPPLRAHSPQVSADRAKRFGSWYYAEHALRVMNGYRWTLIAYSVGNPVMYLFAMGVGLATLVDQNSADAFGGVSYLAFIAPALLAAATIMTAATEFTYPVMDGFKWRRVYYGPHASPLAVHQIVNGYIIAITLRLVLMSTIYFGIVAAFGASPSPWGWAAVPVAVLCGLSFGLPLMAYSASVEEDKGQFALVMRFLVTPMFLFSGTFFPLDTLPIFLQWIGWVSPLWHGTQLGRMLTYGYPVPAWLAVIHLVYLVALAFLGWRLARRTYERRLGK
ncbi:ABC transporter permease [Arthrobacter sp. CAN_C5]|uniref:ABC transporter permease n=1 Tax=Arthrobacter sp. CAN_C5 TaxID=2760706 RepID=UPI001AE35EB6|nr:ABC transporter permease [Arthrobacter sp. CAN_C5]MBP2217855.1 lipooligosaccharide transport system permease protein [Arthrobacter sp. CAN_C5]